jgi:spermidine/putrescine-binding protein
MKKYTYLLIAGAILAGLLAACAAPTPEKELTILVRMMDMQDAWFRENLIPAFEKEHNCKVTVVTFDQFPDIGVMLDLEKKSGRHTIGVVKTPDTEVYPLVAKEYMMPLTDGQWSRVRQG